LPGGILANVMKLLFSDWTMGKLILTGITMCRWWRWWFGTRRETRFIRGRSDSMETNGLKNSF